MRDYVAGLDPYLVNHEVNLNCVPDNAFNGLIKSLVSKYLVTDHFRKKLMPRVDMLWCMSHKSYAKCEMKGKRKIVSV